MPVLRIFVQTNNNKIIERGNLVIFDKDGKGVYIQSVKDSKVPLELLLIGGIPLIKLIVKYGPFVMNIQQEINHRRLQKWKNRTI